MPPAPRSLDETRERTRGGGEDVTAARPAPVLLLLLECDRPFAPSSRHALAGLDAVLLGRASERRVARRGAELEVRIPDERISKRHARLARDSDGWTLEDLGSRNGTLMSAHPVSRARLEDGDLFEVGHTLFLFREQPDAGFPPDFEAARAAVPELATFAAGLRRAFADLARVAASEVPILIQGESGSGKERVARAVHALSSRGGPFTAVNCGALPGELVESELFGYRKGAFSGALEDRVGLVRSADRGTLFLDEIADLAAPSQAALLRVLQEREVLPIGATRPVPIDVRAVAATHHDLPAQVEAGRFRRDLYARVAGFTLHLPPLRERPEDLGILVAALLARHGSHLTLAIDAARALVQHDWPLNVRELEHALGVAAALAEDGRIRLEHLPAAVRAAPAASAPLGEEDERRKGEIVELLRRHAGNVTAVARELGRSRVALHRWIKRYGIDPDRFR
jgi:transcriptional regulator with AAA-type ATPase domain